MAHDHAVVAGASMAGLVAAEALSETYRQVTIVEPDELTDTTTVRRGVPQGEHAHMLLARGAAALEELFPGLIRELADAGARVEQVRVGPDRGMRLVSSSGPFTDAESDATMVGVSRGLLESVVRARVLAHANVTLRTGYRAVGLASGADAGVAGLVVRTGRGADGDSEVVAADLTIDATGRRSSAPRWLAGLGCGEVPETSVGVDVSYATRRLRRPAAPTGGWSGALVHPRLGTNPRLGALLPVENGECVVTLGGLDGHRPPTDPAGFLRWARELPDPCLADAIEESEPISTIHNYRVTTSRLRHYERLARWPAGFLVVGDAVCAFNPIYGQGMSVGALEALALRECLRDTPQALETTFRRRAARTVASPWALASAEDRRWNGDRRTLLSRVQDGVADAARTAATVDPVVARTLMEVFLMLAEPSAMMRPRTVRRVIAGRRSRAGRRAVPPRRDAPVGTTTGT